MMGIQSGRLLGKARLHAIAEALQESLEPYVLPVTAGGRLADVLLDRLPWHGVH
jgi:hypothetical protein